MIFFAITVFLCSFVIFEFCLSSTFYQGTIQAKSIIVSTKSNQPSFGELSWSPSESFFFSNALLQYSCWIKLMIILVYSNSAYRLRTQFFPIFVLFNEKCCKREHSRFLFFIFQCKFVGNFININFVARKFFHRISFIHGFLERIYQT